MNSRLGGGRVAVIGGGPAGLTAAKHLLEHDLHPVVLEQSDDLGGQWNVGAPHSAVWEGMRTNTSKTMTAFSDFPPPASHPMFPRAGQIQDYLRAYASRAGVDAALRTHAHVVGVSRRDDSRWTVHWYDASSARAQAGVFDAVVVASGRFSRPRYPELRGLAGFGSNRRLMHSFDYRTRDELRGLRVLVYGNGDSGLEIAADMAGDDSISVVSACRRPRYVVQKVVRGVPADWQWFTRYAALLGRALSPDELGAELRQAAVDVAGDPAAFGGLPPHPDILATGLSRCQEYLALVAEGSIEVRGGIAAVDRDSVRFDDGSRQSFDVIVCATGYELDLPYLAPEIRVLLGGGDTYLDLYQRTFHPALRGLGFIGQFAMQGPYFPVLELQARWLACVWSGAVEGPSAERMRAGIEDYRQMKPSVRFDVHHVLAEALAAELGVEPDLASRPSLAGPLLFGPLAPARYRLDGPGSLPDAEALYRGAISEFGPAPQPAAEQLGRLRAIAVALGDADLARAAALIGKPEPAMAGS